MKKSSSHFKKFKDDDDYDMGQIHLDSDEEIKNKSENQSFKVQFSEMKTRITSAQYKKRKGKKVNKNDKKDLKKEISMDEHIIPLEELTKRLKTDLINGLSNQEAQMRLREFGRNVLNPPKSESLILKFLKLVFSPLSCLLWVASSLCFLAYALNVAAGLSNLVLGIVLLVVIITSAIMAFIQNFSSQKAIEGFQRMIPLRTTVIREGRKEDIEVAELTIGDIVVVKIGEKIPADIRVIESSALKVDNSSLTGESDPIAKTVEMTDENPLESKNIAFYSTSIIQGSGKGVVIRVGEETVIGRVAKLSSTTNKNRTPLNIELSNFVFISCCFSIFMGVFFFIFGSLIYPIEASIIFMVGILVANVPEGAQINITIILTLAAKRLAKKNMLVKNLDSVETLGSCSTICSDKTGTLTMNQMTVQHFWMNGEITRANSDIVGEEKVIGMDLPAFKMLTNISILCNNATFKENGEGTSGDASESALIKYFNSVREIEQCRYSNPKLVEIPFNSTNKFQVSVHKQENNKDARHLVLMKGAPERIVQRCTKICMLNKLTSQQEEVPLTEDYKNDFVRANEELGGMGERVLGFCYAYLDPVKYDDKYPYDSELENWPFEDMTFCGLVALIDPPKPGVAESVRRCKEAGIKVVMVTGDHPVTAKAIAKQIGIITGDTKEDVAKQMGIDVGQVDDTNLSAIVVPGQELMELTDEELDELLEKYQQIVFARTSPQQKLAIVEGFQRRGEVVAVTGDGVNDSPALKKADIGISMGISGSDVSKDAASMVLLDDNFSSIVNGIEQGRLIFDNLKKTIAYLLCVNMPEMWPYTLNVFGYFPLPLSALLMIVVCCGTDIYPSVSLSFEKPESDIMKRKPRDPKRDKLVSLKLYGFAYFQMGFIEGIAGIFVYFVMMGDFGFQPKSLVGIATFFCNQDKVILFINKFGEVMETSSDYRMDCLTITQTTVFLSLVMTQWGNLLCCKTRRISIFQQGFWNIILNFAPLEEAFLVCMLSYTPLTSIFSTGAIPAKGWFLPIPFVIFMVLYDETRKFLMRQKDWKISSFIEEYSYY